MNIHAGYSLYFPYYSTRFSPGGMTIVAIGTSAPEAAVSIAAALKGSADITIGNIVGSNILDVLIIRSYSKNRTFHPL